MIRNFVTKNLLVLHSGTAVKATITSKIKGLFLSKVSASYQLALVVTPFARLFELITQWTLANSVYIGWVLWAIFVDWVVGILYHLKKKDFDWGKNAVGLSLKTFMALFAGSLFEALPYFLKGQSFISETLILVTRLAVFLYPAGSAWMNMSELTNGVFPPTGWTKKLKAFNENLSLKSLKEEDPAPEENNNNVQL